MLFNERHNECLPYGDEKGPITKTQKMWGFTVVLCFEVLQGNSVVCSGSLCRMPYGSWRRRGREDGGVSKQAPLGCAKRVSCVRPWSTQTPPSVAHGRLTVNTVVTGEVDSTHFQVIPVVDSLRTAGPDYGTKIDALEIGWSLTVSLKAGNG